MKYNLKYVQKTKISQNTQINAKQIMLIEMLKKNNTEIEEELNKLAEENEYIIFKKKSTISNKNDYIVEENTSLENLKKYIYERINAQPDSEEKHIILFLIEKIDNNGFLKDNILTLRNELILTYGIKKTTDEINNVIEKVKKIFPYGIGSRNEKEFKMWQLTKLKENVIITELINKISSGLKKKDINNIKMKKYLPELKNAYELYSKMKKSPKDFFTADDLDFKSNVDFFVHQKGDDKFEINIKKIDIPAIKNNLKNVNLKNIDKKYVDYLRNKQLFAKNLCDNIRKRNEYLEKIMKAIVEIQKNFFVTGNLELLKPMTYDILQKKINMSLSIISRIISNKRVQTDFGIYNLKTLFSKSIVNNRNISVTSVMIKIARIIENNAVITDNEIVKELEKDNILLDRRTVTNYRNKIGFTNSYVRGIEFLLKR